MCSFLISSWLVGCAGNQAIPPKPASETGNLGEPPQAEASREEAGAKKPIILGFYPEAGDKAKDSLLKNIKSLDQVVFFWYTFDEKGKLNPSKSVDLGLKNTVQKNGAKALALVHNLTNEQFNTPLAHKVLVDRTVRSNFVNNLVELATRDNWDGIFMDLEKMDPTDRTNFTTFIQELQGALKAKDKLLQVALHAKYHDDPNDIWAGSYDYSALGKAADQLVIMTYDEHSIGTTQGPIASLSWIKRVVNYATGKIPKEKIILGIPIYGYEWSSNKPLLPNSMSVPRAVSLGKEHGVNILYDEFEQVPHYNFIVGGVRHDVYFENTQSIQAKLEIVQKNQFKGIAIWRLGLEDQSMWTEVLNNFGSQRK
jgi:spore germination protein YaaH